MKREVRKRIKLLDMARKMDTARCIFCGVAGTTKEHVISRRFHKYLDPSPANYSDAVITSLGHTSEQVTFRMPPLRHWQIKCVCGGNKTTCNNGWMRQLDEKMESAASRLIQLPSEEKLPFRVAEEDQKTIATWVIMKAMIAHHSIIHHMQRKQMRAKIEPPDGWGVWIGHYKRSGTWKSEWLSRSFAVIRDGSLARSRSKVAKANSAATTIILQNLFIHVVYCRDRRIVAKWRFTANIEGGPITGHLFKIWPPLGYGISWPGTTLTDRDVIVISNALLGGVMTAGRRLGLIPAVLPTVVDL